MPSSHSRNPHLPMCQPAPEAAPSKIKMLVPVITKKLQASIPFLIGLYCLLTYYNYCVEGELNHLAYVSFLTCVVTAFFNLFGDSSYCDVRYLVDYAQETLVLPCMFSEILTKYSLADNISTWPTYMGIISFASFIILEYKRPDLVDLLTIGCGIGMALVSLYNNNYFGFLAAVLYVSYYCCKKRRETCSMEDNERFNLITSVFNVLSLMALEPKQYFPDMSSE